MPSKHGSTHQLHTGATCALQMLGKLLCLPMAFPPPWPPPWPKSPGSASSGSDEELEDDDDELDEEQAWQLELS